MTSKPAPSSLEPDEPKTETTLTTRIRINIPGSRPIPPVVVRKPVAAEDAPAEPEPAPAASQNEEPPAAPAAAEAPRPEPTSDWFAPRKGATPPPASRPALPGPGAAPAAGSPAGGSDNGGADMNGQGPGQRSGGPRAGLPQRPVGRGPGAPGSPAARGAGAFGAGAPAPGTPPRAPGGRPGGPAAGNGFGPGAPGAPAGNGFAPGAPAGPAAGNGFGPGGPGVPAAPAAPGGPGFPPPAPGAGSAYPQGGPGDGAPRRPAGPTTGPGLGTMPVAPRLDDDTSAFTPQWPGPDLGDDAPTSALPVVPPMPQPGAPAVENPGFDTSAFDTPGVDTSAFDRPAYDAPAFPQGPAAGTGPGRPGPAGPGTAGPGPSGPGTDSPGLSSPAAAPRRPVPKPKKAAAARKGGSKLVLACSGAVALLGVAYGAGLLLNHSDVPKGTTVLGVDIGGSKEEALGKMQQAFGGRATAPIQLTVGGRQVELKPEKAGLSLDSQTTVRNAEGSDYNPLSVIGSLFGNERAADPVVHVDEEKLQVALEDLAGGSGSVVEGTIRFEPNKVTAVPGKAGNALDVDKSMAAVEQAYRKQLETGRAPAVDLPVTSKEPVIDQAELDRMMKEFAEPAMSGKVIVKAGGKSIPFGPALSLPKILGVKAVDGKLVDTYDLVALKELYGDTFDGVLITRGTGEKTPVKPEDVVGVLRQALRGKTAAERTAEIELDPS
ncbi:peptidoglycan binding domain-containing protein [Streptomyces sp. NPDC101132]|uniref:peptidoglycan binding domain-containing protein n=1 Tax=Streptomyces sp. NPDC101132 TaxID=3366110 RepID=UPI003823C688